MKIDIKPLKELSEILPRIRELRDFLKNDFSYYTGKNVLVVNRLTCAIYDLEETEYELSKEVKNVE